MNLNRRGFFGASAGAAIAGPSMAEDALRAQMMDQAIYRGGVVGVAASSARMMEPDDAIRKAFKLGLVSRDKLAELLSGQTLAGAGQVVSVYNLDADLQAAKSYSLAARVRMQRERNLDREIARFLAKPKSFWDFGRDLLTNGIIKEDAA